MRSIIGPQESCAPLDTGAILIFDMSPNSKAATDGNIKVKVILLLGAESHLYQKDFRFATRQFWTTGQTSLLDRFCHIVVRFGIQRDIVPRNCRGSFPSINNCIMGFDAFIINAVQPYKTHTQSGAVSGIELIASDFNTISSCLSSHPGSFVSPGQKGDLQSGNERQESGKYAQNESIESNGVIPCAVPDYRKPFPNGFGYLLLLGGALGLCVGLLYVQCLRW